MRRFLVRTVVEGYRVEFVNYIAAPDARTAEFAVMDLFNAQDFVVDSVEASEIQAFPSEVPVVNAMV
jgi:hypothetical protein